MDCKINLFFWVMQWWGMCLGFFILFCVWEIIRLTKEKRRFLRSNPTIEDLHAQNQVGYPEDWMSMEEAERIWKYRKNETIIDEMISDNSLSQFVNTFIFFLVFITGFAIFAWYNCV